MSITMNVSPKAQEELKKAVQQRQDDEGPQSVRVMVQSQCGCGTAHFAMGFDEPQEGDNRLDLGGVTLLVDPDSAPFLENAEVDYTDDLVGQGFRINAANSGGGGCGCGGHGHSH